MKHTPGPWIEGLDASGIVVVERQTGDVVAELGPFGAHVELVETRLANAKLIAAAPALADALEKAADRFDALATYTEERKTPKDTAILIAWRDDARAALRAAGRLPEEK